jgi:hypothetical protein
MRKHHPKNERIKRQYFTYLEEAGRMNASSVDQVAAAIAQFETSTGHRDFGAFHFEQARKFKRGLTESINPATVARGVQSLEPLLPLLWTITDNGEQSNGCPRAVHGAEHGRDTCIPAEYTKAHPYKKGRVD